MAIRLRAASNGQVFVPVPGSIWEPAPEWKNRERTGAQATDENGIPLWTRSYTVRNAYGAFDIAEISFPSRTQPDPRTDVQSFDLGGDQ